MHLLFDRIFIKELKACIVFTRWKKKHGNMIQMHLRFHKNKNRFCQKNKMWRNVAFETNIFRKDFFFHFNFAKNIFLYLFDTFVKVINGYDYKKTVLTSEMELLLELKYMMFKNLITREANFYWLIVILDACRHLHQ